MGHGRQTARHLFCPGIPITTSTIQRGRRESDDRFRNIGDTGVLDARDPCSNGTSRAVLHERLERRGGDSALAVRPRCDTQRSSARSERCLRAWTMMALKNILVATEFSETSEAAVRVRAPARSRISTASCTFCTSLRTSLQERWASRGTRSTERTAT
jgi:hypothetical protein